MKRTGMTKIRDILRHRHDFALPRSQIAAAVGVSTGTVSHVLGRAEAAGLSWLLTTAKKRAYSLEFRRGALFSADGCAPPP